MLQPPNHYGRFSGAVDMCLRRTMKNHWKTIKGQEYPGLNHIITKKQISRKDGHQEDV